MMQRTQVYLEASEHRRARRKAADLGISMAEYFRRLVRQDLDGPASKGDVSALFALGDSGGSDITSSKDRYVGEAASTHRKRR